MPNEKVNQNSDLVRINDPPSHPIIIYAHQLNQYYHTRLGNPFQRLKYYNTATGQYDFHRTPGILSYIITYYLHQGCLSTETHFPPEILYDELLFFGFNIQMIYEVVSSIITIEYYIPSGRPVRLVSHALSIFAEGRYRRALWLRFESLVVRIPCGLVTLCSVVITGTFLELIHIILFSDDHHNRSSFTALIGKLLVPEILVLVFSAAELGLGYFIRPRLRTTTPFLIAIHCLALTPVSLLLFIWPVAPTWLYSLLVIQFAARILRSVRLSSRAYQLMHALSKQLSIYYESFQAMAIIVLFFGLLILTFEQISSPVQFLLDANATSTGQVQPLSEMIWISINAFTSLGEGTSRPLTFVGLLIEFFTCFVGVLAIPQLAQTTYVIVSNTIDQQSRNQRTRTQKHLVMVEDEHGNRAIGQVDVDERGHWHLPEILIQKDEF